VSERQKHEPTEAFDANDPGRLPIRGRLGFLAKDSAIYGGAAALNAAFSLITFPLLARYFSVADYGVVDFFAVAAAFLAILAIFGQDSAVARLFYEFDSTSVRRRIISQSLAIQLTVCLVIIASLWALADPIGRAIGENGERLFKIVLLQIPFQVLAGFAQNLLKWTFRRVSFVALSVGSIAVRLLMLVIGIFLFEIGIEGVLIINLVVQVGAAIWGMYLVKRWLVVPDGGEYVRELLKFGAPFGVICAIAAFVPAMERSLVVRILGSEELGLYAAGGKIALLITLPIQAFQVAWGPFFLAIYQRADAGITYRWVLKGFSFFVCGGVLLSAIISEPAIRLLASERYVGAVTVVFPLAMGLAIQGVSWITEIGISLSKRSYLSLYGYGASLFTTFFGVLVLAPWLGLLGVALAVMCGYIVKAGVSSFLAQRAYPLPWTYGRIVLLLGLTLIAGLAIVTYMPDIKDIYGWLSPLWIALGYLLVAFLLLFDRKEKRTVMAFIATAYSKRIRG